MYHGTFLKVYGDFFVYFLVGKDRNPVVISMRKREEVDVLRNQTVLKRPNTRAEYPCRISVPKVLGARPRWVCGAHRRVLRLTWLVGAENAVEFSSVFFVDLAAGADVELLALRRDGKRPKVIGRHSTSLRAAVVYTCIWRVRSIKFIRRTIRFAFSSLLQQQAH